MSFQKCIVECYAYLQLKKVTLKKKPQNFLYTKRKHSHIPHLAVFAELRVTERDVFHFTRITIYVFTWQLDLRLCFVFM